MIYNIKILETKVLSDNWYKLNKINYEYTKKDGTKLIQSREVYDRGNGSTILLYNKCKKTVKITEAQKILEAYISPGSVTEILHFFIAEYIKEMKVTDGGGVEHEEENIEVLELKIDEAVKMIKNGEVKDGKTILLLQYIKLNNIL